LRRGSIEATPVANPGFACGGGFGAIWLAPAGYYDVTVDDVGPSGIGRVVEIVDMRVRREYETLDKGMLRVCAKKTAVGWFDELEKLIDFLDASQAARIRRVKASCSAIASVVCPSMRRMATLRWTIRAKYRSQSGCIAVASPSLSPVFKRVIEPWPSSTSIGPLAGLDDHLKAQQSCRIARDPGNGARS
jgi:hypothetical protein